MNEFENETNFKLSKKNQTFPNKFNKTAGNFNDKQKARKLNSVEFVKIETGKQTESKVRSLLKAEIA